MASKKNKTVRNAATIETGEDLSYLVEEQPEKVPSRKTHGKVVLIKRNKIIVSIGNFNQSLNKTSKHDDVKVGDDLEV